MNEAPSFISPTSGNEPTLPENSDSVSTITNNGLTSTDPDAGDTATFTLVDCSDALNEVSVCQFKIQGTELKVNDVGITVWNFNYEFKPTYSLGVRATDSGGLYTQGTLPVLVTNVNDAPSLTTADTVTSVGIQPDVGTVVTQLTASDEDLSHPSSTESLTLSIASGNDDNAWEIVPPSAGGNRVGGQQTYWSIRVKSPLASNLLLSDHTWNLVFTVTDSGGKFANQAVRIVVQDGNARPSLVSPAPTLSIGEDANAGQLVSAVAALFSDGTQADPITMYITSVSPTVNPAALQPGQSRDSTGSGVGFFSNTILELNSLVTQGLFDFERFSSFRLFLTARDWPLRNSPARNFLSKSAEGIFDITITDINEKPLFEGSDGSITLLRVAENTPVGGTVGDVIAKDPDINTVLTFSLSSSNPLDSAPFSVNNVGLAATDSNNNVARITVADSVPLNYEGSKTTFTLVLTASDGALSTPANVQIDLDDAPEPPTLGDATTHVYENDGQWSYCLPFTDPDGADGNIFTLVDPALSSVVQVSSPGCVSGVANGFDFENQDNFVIAVRVTDTENSAFTDDGTLTVSVRDTLDTTITSITPTTLPTQGGEIVLNGTNIGPTTTKLSAMGSDVEREQAQRLQLSFTNPTSGLTVSYQTSNCRVIDANIAAICEVPPGVGSEFTWTLLMGNALPVSANQTLEFSNGFAYQAPVITGVHVNGRDLSTTIDPLLSTSGGTPIRITGTSFGPIGVQASAITVKYARGLAATDLRSNPSGYVASSCSVTLAHTEMTCTSVEGIGKAMEFWLSNLAGSYSNVLSTHQTSFHLPTVTSVAIKAGTDSTAATLPTEGGTAVLIQGTNFGPASVLSNSDLSSVSYGGETAFGYTATSCAVTVAQTEIQCTTASGTGDNHKWNIVLADQSSGVSTFHTSYAPPILTSVSGQSLSSADTQGGLRITILGSAFGNSVANTITNAQNIVIKYGPATANKASWYTCSNVLLVAPSTAVSCLMDPGTGAGHSMVITVDGQESNSLANAISYAPPVIILFAGPGAAYANTSGSELIFITGRNFGPAGIQNIDSVRYGRSIDAAEEWLSAVDCEIVVSHFRMKCSTTAGAGTDLRWNVTIDGQNSTSPTTDYAPPSISSISTLSGASFTSASANGNQKLVLSGSNFGPIGTRLVNGVTFGPQGRQYAAKACRVTWLSREITCDTPPGIGTSLRFFVNIGGQTSSLSSSSLSYSAPTITSTSRTTIPSAGISVDFSGTNFGLLVDGIGIRVAFGSVMLLASATSQSNTGVDTVSVNIPPLNDASMSMTNILSVLELTSGATVLTSSAVMLSYESPTITKVFTYEGESAALRMVVQGENLCGGVACGAVEVRDQNGQSVAIHRYISYSHTRVEMEMNTDKGSLRIAVGASTIGHQYSDWKTFEHMSPVIDNKDAIALQRFSTIGGDLVTIEGRYFRTSNVELWVGTTKGTILTITQNAERGPHWYTVVGQMPGGEGLNNNLYIKLPSTGGSVAAAESEAALMNYNPPSQVQMDVHHFPTTGGSVLLTGVDLGLCAFLLVDNVLYQPNGDKCSSSNAVTSHTSVRLKLPDGEGKGHVLSVSIGGQILSSTTGWAIASSQCSDGKGLANRFGWFDYDAPVVSTITPPQVSTSGGTVLTLIGTNFGTGTPTVTLHGRTTSGDSTNCNCDVKLKSACVAGFGCTASICCAAERPGCGCYGIGCGCCKTVSTCTVTASSHTSITCQLQEGQGTELEVVVDVTGQTSSDGSASLIPFSYLPPNIVSASPLSSPTMGGVVVTLHGESFGLRDATVTLLGDGLASAGSPLSTNIGPIAVDFQNHTTILFTVPEGHGTHRSIRLDVDGQSHVYVAAPFHYEAPTFTFLEQPAPCTTRVRTTACGSPTQGSFIMLLHGNNLGTMATSRPTVTIGEQQCCVADKSISGNDDCATVGSALSINCACCVTAQTHNMLTISAPSGVGSNVPVTLDYVYRGWTFKAALSYDPPYINFVNPQLGNANGGLVSFHGINFGDVYQGGNVTSIVLGNVTCSDVRWTGTGPTDEAVTCTIGPDTAGPKSVQMTVGGQTSRWESGEWKTSTGHRLYFAECPASYYGKIGEPCFECTYVTDNDGVIVVDSRGEKQYAALCSGGDAEPIAKQGFYRTELQRQCGTDITKPCTNDTQCDAGVLCSFEHVVGEEYCNDTLKELRSSCSYVLACEPTEACEANNICSVIEEGTKDLITGKDLDPHGYANTTMAGVPVQRCSQCSRGYFRVGGRCEMCPTNILLLAVLFICGIVGISVAGYVLHVFKVNLAMAAIGIDYAQVMSMFLKSDIRWPAQIRTLFRILSSFNFDLDVASPECLIQEYYRYDLKWYSIMGMPIGMAFIFLCVHCALWFKKRYLDGRKTNLNKHAHVMVSMNLVMMYFLYLYLTRSALDVFNCVALDPPDAVHPEYTYMTAVGGVRCYEAGSLQMQLLPLALLGIFVYTIGYPVVLMLLFWRNRVRIQRDQYLRACGEGDKREKTDLFNVYNIRKRYSSLYYQFKPRCYYWTVVIIARKFSIAFINLMLRQDVDYMLAASLLVMFIAFSTQLLNRPFMGPAEYQKVRTNWNVRTASVSAMPLALMTSSSKDAVYDSSQQIRNPLNNVGGSRVNKSHKAMNKRNVRSTMGKLRSGGVSGGKKFLQWMVNYNTVEAILLFCSVLVMLGGIMFSSSRFDNNKNQSELQTITWTVMIIIILSLIYYAAVLFLEITAQTCPNRFCCDLGKHLGDGFVDRQKKKRAYRKSQMILGNNSSDVEMSMNPSNSSSSGVSTGDKELKSKEVKKTKSKIRKQKGRAGNSKKPLINLRKAEEETGNWKTHTDPKTGKSCKSNLSVF